MRPIDKLQAALDTVGFEPTYGTAADAANVVISTLRAASAGEKDERKKHLINAGISAVSLVPFADVIKLLKLRKVSKPLTKAAIKGSRAIKGATTSKKMSGDRFTEQINIYLTQYSL